LHFTTNGGFRAKGMNVASSYTPLWRFNQYEMLANNKIRFFNSTTSDAMIVSFEMGQQLSFYYPFRCAFEEKFIRKN
jgi:hypothetical protein